MSADAIHKATALAKQALAAHERGNSAECDALISGNGHQMAKALIMAHDMIWSPPHIKNYNS